MRLHFLVHFLVSVLMIMAALSSARAEDGQAAEQAIVATSVTLTATNLSVVDALEAIEKQTGNKVSNQEGQERIEHQTSVTVDFQNEPYWSAIDQLLDEANLSVYPYASDDVLAIIEREPGNGPRHGRAAYGGPFRMEVLEVQSQRNTRQANQKSLKLQLEVAWEPRLRPIAVSQRVADLAASDETGTAIQTTHPEAVLSAEIPLGTIATELVLPFELPTRDVMKIASLKGKLMALVPSRHEKFKFDDLAHAGGKSERRGDVEVAIDSVRKNNEVWELHMRLRLDEKSKALKMHRGWAFENLSYLVDQKGGRIENAGLETTSQGKNEVGVAYFFDLPDGLDGLTWVYETPAAIMELPIEYEIKNIELP